MIWLKKKIQGKVSATFLAFKQKIVKGKNLTFRKKLAVEFHPIFACKEGYTLADSIKNFTTKIKKNILGKNNLSFQVKKILLGNLIGKKIQRKVSAT